MMGAIMKTFLRICILTPFLGLRAAPEASYGTPLGRWEVHPRSPMAWFGIPMPALDLGSWLGTLDHDEPLLPLKAGQFERVVRGLEEDVQAQERGWQRSAISLLAAAQWGLEDRTGIFTAPAKQLPSLAGPQVRRAVTRAFDRILAGGAGESVLGWMELELFFSPTIGDLPARRTALARLLTLRRPAMEGALLTLARDESDLLRPELLDALAQWQAEATDLYLVRLLGQVSPAGAQRQPFNLVLTRLEEGDATLGTRAKVALKERVGIMIVSTDWRKALRGLAIVSKLDPTDSVPLLLHALTVWERRLESGHGARRVVSTVTNTLKLISGRSAMASQSRAWNTWWGAVQSGDSPLHVEGQAHGESRTSARFFGLAPQSDQVTFIIDRSGSMEAGWGTTGHNRYVEAVEQMTRFLQISGPATRFEVILFSDSLKRSAGGLVPATARNIARARKSLLSRSPNGGTDLRPAVEMVMGVRRFGPQVQPESDTVVVLCDGDTVSGSHWVEPFLHQYNLNACVKFECVLVGTKGDGSLEALAQHSGGSFVRIDG